MLTSLREDEREMLENRISFSFPQVYKGIFLFVTIPYTVATVETFFQAQID